MTVPNTADAARISKIASRMESPHDGEVLNAARMLIKHLGGHGLRISDVVERGISVGLSRIEAPDYAFRRRPSPPTSHHRIKILALLDDPAVMGAYLTRRSLARLQELYRAPYVDAVTMGWIDGLLDKARELRAGRVA